MTDPIATREIRALRQSLKQTQDTVNYLLKEITSLRTGDKRQAMRVQDEKVQPDLLSVLAKVSMHFFVHPDRILSDRRNKSFVRARHAFYRLAYEKTNASQSQIARFCGGRDHTTIAHGLNRAGQRLKNDDSFRHAYEAAEASLVAAKKKVA